MRRLIAILSLVLVGAAGGLAACNLALGLDDLKDQVDGGPADSGAKDDRDHLAVDASPPNCVSYCDAIPLLCVPPNSQYSGWETCTNICATFPSGSSTQSANTLRCRADYLARAADASNPEVFCASAGPYAPSCGGEVADFCSLYNRSSCTNGYVNCESEFGAILDANADGAHCREFQLVTSFRKSPGAACAGAAKDSSTCL